MFLQTCRNEFIVAGSGDAQITFYHRPTRTPIVGIVSIDELFFEKGAWSTGRPLNGNETTQGKRCASTPPTTRKAKSIESGRLAIASRSFSIRMKKQS